MKVASTLTKFSQHHKMHFKFLIGILINGMSLSVLGQNDSLNPSMSPPDFRQNEGDELKVKNQNLSKPSYEQKNNTIQLKQEDAKNKALVKPVQKGTIQTQKEMQSDSEKGIGASQNMDGVKMENGKVFFSNMGKVTWIQEKLIMNGITVLSNAKIIKKDGSSFYLAEGEFIDMNGNRINKLGTRINH